MQNQKQEGEKKKKWLNHLESFPFHTLEELFHLANPWSGNEGEEFKPFKFKMNMRVWEDLQEEQRRIETDSGFPMRSWCCSVEWCCEILKYSQVYEPYRIIVGQEWGQIHKDLYECRKIN